MVEKSSTIDRYNFSSIALNKQENSNIKTKIIAYISDYSAFAPD
jgi:hypothetical protein